MKMTNVQSLALLLYLKVADAEWHQQYNQRGTLVQHNTRQERNLMINLFSKGGWRLTKKGRYCLKEKITNFGDQWRKFYHNPTTKKKLHQT